MPENRCVQPNANNIQHLTSAFYQVLLCYVLFSMLPAVKAYFAYYILFSFVARMRFTVTRFGPDALPLFSSRFEIRALLRIAYWHFHTIFD